MRRSVWTLVLMATGLLPAPGHAADEGLAQCAFPANPAPPSADDDQRLTIDADRSELWQDGRANFSGDVSVSRGSYRLSADDLTLSSDRQQFSAQGGITLDSSQLHVDSDRLLTNSDDGSATLINSRYHFYGRQGHGQAQELTLYRSQDVTMKEGSFTTCPPGNHSWRVSAEEIRIDGSSQMAELESGWFYIHEMPVLYLPYFTMPVGDQRKSGLLYPSITSSSKRGLDIEQPIYWNIAPDMDATISPRYMSKKGAQLLTEFRYLTETHRGRSVVEYLHRDRELDSNDARYLLHYDHQAQWNDHLRAGIDFSQVSDDNYLNDIGSDVASSTSNRLERNAFIGYLDHDWRSSLTISDYQVFGSGALPYRELPRVDFSYAPQRRWYGLAPDLDLQLVQFAGNDAEQDSASRLHLEPGVTLPWAAPAGHLELEGRLYQTFYHQTSNDPALASSVSRTLPFFRAEGQLNFDREGSYNGRSYTQTLEPRLQYLYVPYENQDEIGLYDTNTLPTSYDGLFRTRRFAGWDRISNADQLTAGVTSRLLDRGSEERANISVGQIFFFDAPRVALDPNERLNDESQSDVASDLNLWLGDHWYFQNRLQFDNWNGGLLYNGTVLDYRTADGKGVQLSYRDLPRITPTDAVKQAGITGLWPLSDHWRTVVSLQRDLVLDRSIEVFTALQYENCCYALQFGYQRNITTRFAEDSASQDVAEFDGGIFFQIALRGFGNSDGADELLRDTLFGRYDPYQLSD
ncbi:MAG: LPS assembly protein LptD [Corallincola sp.]|nr:LPS assembly protein LptD [Corallincola sp.]